MKHLISLALLHASAVAHADTAATDWTAPECVLKRSATNIATGVSTLADASKKRDADIEARKASGNYSRVCTEKSSGTYSAPCPATPPASAVQSRAQGCPIGTYSPTGAGWPQTAAAVTAPKPACWAQGSTWLPAVPTVAQCPSIPPQPSTSELVACVAPQTGAGWTRTRTNTWDGLKWVSRAWAPATAPTGFCSMPPPTTETVTNWVTVSNEQFPAFAANGAVRYGHAAYPNNWVVKTLSGEQDCRGSTFGNVDPAPGLYKQCQVQLTAPNVVQTGGMPVVNVPLLPPPQRGYSTAMITNGGGFDVGPFDIGAFRTNCGVSHFAFDDPIVFPGQPGKSHLHMFFGNTGINAFTTKDNVTTTGDSTCAGGILNRTGYWVPAMVNLKTGAPVVPSGSIWYYKGAYMGVRSEDIKPFPAGLRLIAGNSGGTTARTDDLVRFGCASQGIVTRSIPNCAVGDQVTIGIQFPQCWDGVNIDSPDHKSHMAYGGGDGKGCPSTHPVGLPEISLNVAFTVTEARPDLNWKLASDNYAGTGGYSMHADWFNGWRDDIMKTWVAKCINTKASSSNAICDGRYLSD